MQESQFDAAEFLRRQEAGEFDATLADEIDQLSLSELEELAILLTGQIRAKAASAT